MLMDGAYLSMLEAGWRLHMLRCIAWLAVKKKKNDGDNTQTKKASKTCEY